MNGFLLTLHIIVSIILIGGILLQPGAKGGGLGASFGGGGAHSAFGAQGAAPFLAKLTYWLGAAFLATSLLIELHIVASNQTVLDRGKTTKPAAAKPAPAQPVPAQPVPATPTPAAPEKK